MRDLIAFLRARLNEDEEVARAAYDSPWRPDDDHVWTGRDRDPDEGPTVYVNGGVDRNKRATARHIACHDPARVLAEVEAKRQILEECTAADEFGDEGQRVMAVRVIELLMMPYAEHEEDRLLLEEAERRLANDNGVRHDLDDVIGKSIRRWWNLLERLKGK